MDKLTFKPNSINYSPNEVKLSPSQSESFSAIDKEKLKQDTVELTQNTVKENFIFRILRDTFGVKDPKKCLNSIFLTAIATIGVATLGNKSVKFMANMGLKVDDFLLNNKTYMKFSNALQNGAKKVGNFLKKSKTINDISQTLKTKKAKPKIAIAKGTGQGFPTQFSFTVGDVVHTAPYKICKNSLKDLNLSRKASDQLLDSLSDCVDKQSILNKLSAYNFDSRKAEKLADDLMGFKASLGKLIGNGFEETLADGTKINKDLNYFFKNFTNSINNDQRAFANDLTLAIAKNAGLDPKSPTYQKDLCELLIKLKNNEFGQEFNNLAMNREGFIGGWWPANIINTVGKKIKGDKWKNFGEGNLGDALLKYNITSGKTAKTKLGKLVQNSVLCPSESISNFVCDFAGMNLFFIPQIYNLFNTAQDAPKGQKVATVADDFIGSIGNIAITSPLAFATTYGLASLNNLEGKTFISKHILKPMGKFFAMGLGNKSSFPARFLGGVMRFVMIMFILTPKFSKPLTNAIHKVFGKPYDPAEEQKNAEIEAQKKQIIPELGITQEEFINKIQQNPKAIEELQKNPQLALKLKENPKLLVDYLDGKDINQVSQNSPQAPKKQGLSQANMNLINNKQNLFSPKKEENKTANTKQRDTATYIPSSDFIAKPYSISEEKTAEIQQALANADKALKEAEKFI